MIKAEIYAELLNRAESEIKNLTTKLKSLNLKINMEKCGTLICYNSDTDNSIFDININNKIIKNFLQVKSILGITIDKSLNFNINAKMS